MARAVVQLDAPAGKMKELRKLEDRNSPANTFQIKEGKLVKNGVDCIDEFDVCNQLFQ